MQHRLLYLMISGSGMCLLPRDCSASVWLCIQPALAAGTNSCSACHAADMRSSCAAWRQMWEDDLLMGRSSATISLHCTALQLLKLLSTSSVCRVSLLPAAAAAKRRGAVQPSGGPLRPQPPHGHV
jgi:hypothetical protein